ncbi:MAG: single-stranded DNA-binding protein [Cyanobacteria bacterium P01_H01_bin.121]
MNNFVVMAEVIQAPQTRYTQDGQTPIAEMTVQFPGLRADDPPATLRAVGWGNMAQTVQAQCKLGDHLLLQGRLRMNTVDRQEGFKEKVAELTLSSVYHATGQTIASSSDSGAPAQSATTTGAPAAPPTPVAPVTAAPADPPDYDNIPF